MGPEELTARLDRLPLSRFHRRVIAGLALAFFFELADLNSFAYAAPGLIKFDGLSIPQVAHITSASFAGLFVGAAIGGHLSDRYGRIWILIRAVLVYSVFSLLNAAISSVDAFYVVRFLTGVGLAAMTVISITYLAEVMPAERRGRIQAGTLAIGLVGIPAISFFARGVVPLGSDGWRLVFVFGAFGFLALAIIVRLPESPRWLLRVGREEDAARTLEGLEEAARAEHGELPEPIVGEVVVERQGRIVELFGVDLRRRTIVLWGMWILQTLGFYGFVSWVPTLLQAHGLSLVNSLGYAALATLGGVPGALLAWPLTDRIGRRNALVLTATAVAVCGLVYGLTFSPVLIVVFGFLVNAFLQTFAALAYAYTPELYPTNIRSSGSGLAYGVGRLANIAGPSIVSALFLAAGYVSVFVYIAATWALAALLIGVLGSSTERRSLEVVNRTSGRPRDLGFTRRPSGRLSP